MTRDASKKTYTGVLVFGEIVPRIFIRLFLFTDKKKPHIKKPLNAFMLYMKEMRAKVVAECTLKESAAINQILGRRVSSQTLTSTEMFYFFNIFFSYY